MSDVTVDVTDAPVEAPAQLPADAPIEAAPASDDLDSLLQEFDRVTTKPESEPEPAADGNVPAENVSNDELDKLLLDLNGPTAD
jgi:hypothetical protein